MENFSKQTSFTGKPLVKKQSISDDMSLFSKASPKHEITFKTDREKISDEGSASRFKENHLLISGEV